MAGEESGISNSTVSLPVPASSIGSQDSDSSPGPRAGAGCFAAPPLARSRSVGAGAFADGLSPPESPPRSQPPSTAMRARAREPAAVLRRVSMRILKCYRRVRPPHYRPCRSRWQLGALDCALVEGEVGFKPREHVLEQRVHDCCEENEHDEKLHDPRAGK